MLTKFGLTAVGWVEKTPWTNVYGVARTVLALGTLGTLLFTPSGALFAPALGVPPAPYCTSASSISLFCVVPERYVEPARWLGVLILMVVASGWRPRLTALPHWWVAFSLQASATIPDGGDHVTAVLTLLSLPVALTDRRRWHWRAAEAGAAAGPPQALVAVVALFLVRLQVAAIYLHAGIAKLGVAEWRDGTALYYWLIWLGRETPRETGQVPSELTHASKAVGTG